MPTLATRIDRLEKRVHPPSAPPGPPLRITEVIAWPLDAQRAYEAASEAGDAAAVAELMERHEGIPQPEPEQRRRRRPLVNRPPRVIELIVCQALDEREPVEEEDIRTPGVRTETPVPKPPVPPEPTAPSINRWGELVYPTPPPAPSGGYSETLPGERREITYRRGAL